MKKLLFFLLLLPTISYAQFDAYPNRYGYMYIDAIWIAYVKQGNDSIYVAHLNYSSKTEAPKITVFPKLIHNCQQIILITTEGLYRGDNLKNQMIKQYAILRDETYQVTAIKQ